MTDENIINNPYLDIVDAAVLGNTSDAANSIESALKDKISAELENMTSDIGADILDDDEDVDTEEYDEDDNDLETESDEDQSEN